MKQMTDWELHDYLLRRILGKSFCQVVSDLHLLTLWQIHLYLNITNIRAHYIRAHYGAQELDISIYPWFALTLNVTEIHPMTYGQSQGYHFLGRQS